MKDSRLSLVASWLAVLLAIVFAVSAVHAQPLSGLGGGAALGEEQHVKPAAWFTLPASGKLAMLYVTAEITPGWHIFSITQAPGGPIRSRIKLTESPNYKLTGEFRALQQPAVHEYPEFWQGIKVEEHAGRVTWAAPIEFAAGVDPARLEIPGALHAQVCSTSCLMPQDYKFVARLGRDNPAPVAVTAATSIPQPTAVEPPPAVRPQPQGVLRYRAEFSHVTLTGHIEPPVVAPGATARLVITAEPESPWHVYALADKDPNDVSKPTLIVLTDTSGLKYGRATPDALPVEKAVDAKLSKSGKSRYHDRPVTWTIPLQVPADARAGNYPIAGIIGYQTCEETQCDPPRAAWFQGALTVSDAANADRASQSGGTAPLLFRAGTYTEAAKLAAGIATPVSIGAAGQDQSKGANSDGIGVPRFEIVELNSRATGTLAVILASAFIGGFILNFMPCVLPVIGLKILSFVEQSHQSRGRVLALNLWYSLGLISVFMVLATFAAGASLGLRSENLAWGEQFNSTPFNIAMCGVVFALALSFLGVWEIPIPGFAGSGKAAHAASQEGAAGAFAKGVLSTILATPCSGPLLGAVFAFTLKQPAGITFAVFGAIGLGMASPYLVIGAFPRLIRFLPKPGAWMDTFKHIMGFVLLGTVVFLFTFLDRAYLVATFAMLIGIWAACWWIGRVPLTAELGAKLRGWAGGAVVAAAIGFLSFTWLVESKSQRLPWKPFSIAALERYRSQGKTVMVDFTANWCLTCKFNLQFAVNTEDVHKVVNSNEVVALLADFSDIDGSPEIKEMLQALNSTSIPLLAIFPADSPNEARLLRDLITKRQVVNALEDAGPSRSIARTGATAMQ